MPPGLPPPSETPSSLRSAASFSSVVSTGPSTSTAASEASASPNPQSAKKENKNDKSTPQSQLEGLTLADKPPVPKAAKPTSATAKGANAGARPKVIVQPSQMITPDKAQYKIPRSKNLMEKKQKKLGTAGRAIKVKVNHLKMNIKLKSVIQYDVKVTAPWKRTNRKSDASLFRRAFEKLKKDNPTKFKKPYAVVFDGQTIAYSTYDLFPANGYSTSVELKEIPDIDRMIKLEFAFTRVGEVDISDTIKHYNEEGSTIMRMEEGVTAAISVINTIFSYLQSCDQTKVMIRSSAFSPPKGHVVELGGGKALWEGLFASFRPAWKPFVNVEMAHKPGYQNSGVLQFFEKVMEGERRGRGRGPPDFSRLHKNDEDILNNAIKGLKIRCSVPPPRNPKGQPIKRDYRAVGLGPKGYQKVVTTDDGRKISVAEYFMEKEDYKYEIRYKNFPTLQVGNPTKNIYIPLELTSIKQQPCPTSKRLTGQETTYMIKQTAVKPEEREKKILDGVKNSGLLNNGYCQEFQLSVADKFTEVDARILNPPKIGYRPQGGDVEAREIVKVKDGKWEVETVQRKPLHFVDGKELKDWAVLNLDDRLQIGVMRNFVDGLYAAGQKCGFNIDYPFDYYNRQGTLEQRFSKIIRDLEKEGRELKLLMCFVGFKGDESYAIVKLLGDSRFNIPTQFVLSKNVNDKKPQTLHNICLKLNTKLGGVNQVLVNPDIEKVNFKNFKVPIMFIGADVTHPAPDQMGAKPSIAAMVGSMDPMISQYNCEVRIQTGGQVVEVIEDTESMVYNLLKKFYNRSNQKKPQKLIYYRDGVSEGQFLDVMNRELSAMRRACMKLEDGYEPGITFVVAQKRHKTRLFPVDYKKNALKNGNVLPGTVVDTEITNPTEESFFLASHEGIQVS